MMKFTGFEHGMGIGGWLTNYKRFNVIPVEKRFDITIGDMEHFATYITRRDVDYIASLGMDHIRMGFDQIVLEERPGVYREVILKLIDDFVGWCEDAGINIVLNLHKAIGNYCDIPEKVKLMDSPELQQRFIDLWLMLERRYAHKPDIVFELLNEVVDINPELWNDLAEKTIAALRKLNPQRKLIIGGRCWNSAAELKTLRVWDDPAVIYTFHCYSPFEFTHQRGVLQYSTLYYNREMPYPGDVERYRDFQRVVNHLDNAYPGLERIDKEYLRRVLAPAVEFTRLHPDKILWCGEFGTIRHAKLEWRENYMRDLISLLKEYDIPYCSWNYLSTPNDGNRFSLVDDDRREILSPELARIIAGKV